MTNPNVEITRAFFEGLGRGEIRADLLHPDLLITMTHGFLIADEYRGADGFAHWWKDVAGDLDNPTCVLEELVEAGSDLCLAKCRVSGRARTAGMDVDLVWWSAAGYRDSQIARLAGATSKRHARELADQIAAELAAGQRRA